MDVPRFLITILKCALILIMAIGNYQLFVNILYIDENGNLVVHDWVTDLRVEQAGDYWVIHNFKKAKHAYYDNESITLVSWATIQDMANLKEIVVR